MRKGMKPMPRFTPYQQRAIDLEGKNILVSAGAGSGKTAVLSQRVIRKLQMGVHIDELVILTFTNAAAAEMKQRITEEIQSRASLHDELKRLDQAVIATFDSFARLIIEENHALLERSHNIQLVDSVELIRIQDQLLEQCIDEAISASSATELAMLEKYFDQGDALIKQGILTLFEGIEKLPDPIGYLDNYQKTCGDHSNIEHQFDAFFRLMSQQVTLLEQAFHRFVRLASCFHDAKLDTYVEGVSHILSNLRLCSDYDAFHALLHQTFPSIRKMDPEWKELLDPALDLFKQQLKQLRDITKKLFAPTKAAAIQAVCQTIPMVEWIIRITKKFYQSYTSYLKFHRLDTFQSLFRDVLRLFEEHPWLRIQYQQRYQEIMVDEYQDTNDFQELFLQYISKQNIFFVGDVKQSIYGFRNANPNNFIQKMKQYLQTNQGEVVFLPDNFRSRQEIIIGINSLFQGIMDERLGGVDYQAGHALAYGQKAFDLEPKPQAETGIVMARYHNQVDESSRAYQEGRVIASDILTKLQADLRVFHKGEFRKATYRDFAVIVDRKSDFFEYLRALNEYGIPVYMIGDESFQAQAEIQTATNALKLFACFVNRDFSSPFFQRAFYGFGRSYVCQFEDEPLLDYLLTCQDNPNPQSFFQEHPLFSNLYHRFESIQKDSSLYSIDRILGLIYEKFDFIHRCVDLENPEAAVEKLLFLLEKFQSMPLFGLSQAIAYVEALEQRKELDIEYQKPLDLELDAVMLLTMHKSKGLEFPICYYPGFTKQFYMPESKAFFLFDPEIGLIMKSYQLGFFDTFLRHLWLQKQKQSVASERVRLLYVALTRAKEQAIILIDEEEWDLCQTWEDHFLTFENRMRVHSFMEMIQCSPDVQTWPTIKPAKPTALSLVQDAAKTTKTPQFYERKTQPTPSLEPISQQLHLPSRIPSMIQKQGTRFHHVLEHVDFKQKTIAIASLNPTEEQIVTQLWNAPWLHPETIVTVYHEYPLLDEQNQVAVIDCIVEYESMVLVIDYKTKQIEKSEYQMQVKRYLQALQHMTSKRVKGVLYSLLEGEVEWIEFN